MTGTNIEAQQSPGDGSTNLPQSLAEFSSSFGMKRVNLLPYVQLLLDRKVLPEELSPKAKIDTYGAVIVQEVWGSIKQQIAAEPAAHGLGMINDLRLFASIVDTSTQSRGQIEKLQYLALPGKYVPEFADQWSELEFEELIDTLKTQTQATMYFHLLNWELEQIRLDRPLYNEYIDLISNYRPEFMQTPVPATSALLGGFRFGHDTIWRLKAITPDLIKNSLGESVTGENLEQMAEAELILLEMWASDHILLVMEHDKLLRDGKQANNFSAENFICSRRSNGRIRWEVRSNVAEGLDKQKTLIEATMQFAHLTGQHGFVPEINNCSAMYSDAFKGIQRWITSVFTTFVNPAIVESTTP